MLIEAQDKLRLNLMAGSYLKEKLKRHLEMQKIQKHAVKFFYSQKMNKLYRKLTIMIG